MSLSYRTPRVADGPTLWRLVRETGVLDENARYTYASICRHFASTSVVAELDGEIVGFVTGYRIPDRPEVLFVWQVGVSAAARGRGVATRMLREILERTKGEGDLFLETTVTPSNVASRRLFSGLARDLGTECSVLPCFGEEELGGHHEPEELFRIGPIRSL